MLKLDDEDADIPVLTIHRVRGEDSTRAISQLAEEEETIAPEQRPAGPPNELTRAAGARRLAKATAPKKDPPYRQRTDDDYGEADL